MTQKRAWVLTLILSGSCFLSYSYGKDAGLNTGKEIVRKTFSKYFPKTTSQVFSK